MVNGGVMLTSLMRRTLWPRGVTPVFSCWGRRDRISSITGVTLSSQFRLPGLRFRPLYDNTNATSAVIVVYLWAWKDSHPHLTVM
jgi:hypothetical protein